MSRTWIKDFKKPIRVGVNQGITTYRDIRKNKEKLPKEGDLTQNPGNSGIEDNQITIKGITTDNQYAYARVYQDLEEGPKKVFYKMTDLIPLDNEIDTKLFLEDEYEIYNPNTYDFETIKQKGDLYSKTNDETNDKLFGYLLKNYDDGAYTSYKLIIDNKNDIYYTGNDGKTKITETIILEMRKTHFFVFIKLNDKKNQQIIEKFKRGVFNTLGNKTTAVRKGVGFAGLAAYNLALPLPLLRSLSNAIKGDRPEVDVRLDILEASVSRIEDMFRNYVKTDNKDDEINMKLKEIELERYEDTSVVNPLADQNPNTSSSPTSPPPPPTTKEGGNLSRRKTLKRKKSKQKTLKRKKSKRKP